MHGSLAWQLPPEAASPRPAAPGAVTRGTATTRGDSAGTCLRASPDSLTAARLLGHREGEHCSHAGGTARPSVMATALGQPRVLPRPVGGAHAVAGPGAPGAPCRGRGQALRACVKGVFRQRQNLWDRKGQAVPGHSGGGEALAGCSWARGREAAAPPCCPARGRPASRSPSSVSGPGRECRAPGTCRASSDPTAAGPPDRLPSPTGPHRAVQNRVCPCRRPVHRPPAASGGLSRRLREIPRNPGAGGAGGSPPPSPAPPTPGLPAAAEAAAPCRSAGRRPRAGAGRWQCGLLGGCRGAQVWGGFAACASH